MSSASCDGLGAVTGVREEDERLIVEHADGRERDAGQFFHDVMAEAWFFGAGEAWSERLWGPYPTRRQALDESLRLAREGWL